MRERSERGGDTAAVGTEAAGSSSLVEQPPAASPVRDRAHSTRTSRGVRLLVVDDNADAAESLKLLLEMLGHDVRAAGDGPTALDVAAVFAPEVVLLDIGLPGMDGCEVARRMRDLPATRDAYLVALTGYGRESDRARARESGFDRHELKPVSAEVLDKLIRARQRARR